MSLPDLSPLEWIPEITYTDCDTPVTCELLIPMGQWRYRSRGNGGRDEAASGVTESFVIRHDRTLVLRLRFTEEEWVEKVEPWLMTVHAQEQAFTILLDKSDALTEHEVRLVSPVTGDDVEPTENPFDGVLELEVAVRTEDGSTFSYPYFPSLE